VVSGQLRRHPYARFQRDAGIGVVFKNSFLAAVAALHAGSRRQALLSLESHLRRLARRLDDARALTLVCDLSDSFGRLQIEIRSVLSALDSVLTTLEQRAKVEQRTALERETPGSRAPVAARPATRYAMTADADWPYLAL
jgi:hypothetical protein